jgi:hypothetical protein
MHRAAAFLAKALLLGSLSFTFPFAFAQHGSHSGSSHPSAPHMSAPHMSAPHNAARPTYRPPAYRGGGPGYHGAVPSRPYPDSPSRFTPAPVPPGPPSAYRPYPVQRAPYAAPPSNVRGPHLGNWLQNHQGESFTGQENALRREPGFNRLPQPQQQRLIDRLHQLDSMPPQQRQRWIGRNENMERLSPERRQEVRSSVQELHSMNPTRKQQVQAAWRVLRDMPPAQREHVLNSPAYRSMYSDHERQILGNLLSVEPYQPR